VCHWMEALDFLPVVNCTQAATDPGQRLLGLSPARLSYPTIVSTSSANQSVSVGRVHDVCADRQKHCYLSDSLFRGLSSYFCSVAECFLMTCCELRTVKQKRARQSCLLAARSQVSSCESTCNNCGVRRRGRTQPTSDEE
jgi:hypothetical protein